MQIVGAVLVVFSLLCLLIAVYFYFLYRIFDYHTNKTKKVMAHLTNVKHKTDVRIYGRRTLNGPFRVLSKIKHYSKGTYEYTAENKQYKIYYVEYITAKQMPRTISVVYLKKFPIIAYAQTEIHTHNFDVYSLASFLLGIICVISGFSAIYL